jgi:hypothetical protein
MYGNICKFDIVELVSDMMLDAATIIQISK